MRRSWAGFPQGKPLVMGILNVTPDSFSDGGKNNDPVGAGLAMVEAGADLIDIGGESTRPGAADLPVEEEISRIRSVIAALARAGVAVSVDTRNAETMRVALGEGARIINDVSGFAYDPDALRVVAQAGCPVVVMHMRGRPATMNSFAAYDDLVADVRRELAARVDDALQAGVRAEAICIDPGLGFAKNAAQDAELLQRLPELDLSDHPVLIGASRKRFVGALSGEAVAAHRIGGSVAAALWAVAHGADILRVHDVAQTVQAIRVWRGLGGLM